MQYIYIYVYIHEYACGPKTVLVESTFLGFLTKLVFGPVVTGGVGWDGV